MAGPVIGTAGLQVESRAAAILQRAACGQWPKMVEGGIENNPQQALSALPNTDRLGM